MKNTITITISKNTILAHALYEVICKHYEEDAGEVVFHSGSSEVGISFLLKNPSVLCNLNYASGDMTEYVNNEWSELLTDREVKWKAFIEDILYYVSNYNPKYSYEEDSYTVYTNTGKVLVLADKYISGKTELPYDILNSLDDSECYKIGKATIETYATYKARFDVRSDDSKDFFENVEYFDGGYIEFVSEAIKYSWEFNSVAYTSDEVVFYDLDINKKYNQKFCIIPDHIINIVLVNKGVHIGKHDAEYEDCKYLLTTKDGVKIFVNAFYLKEN